MDILNRKGDNLLEEVMVTPVLDRLRANFP